MFHTYQHVRIVAINASVPKQEICLKDEIDYYGGSLKKIERIPAFVTPALSSIEIILFLLLLELPNQRITSMFRRLQ